MIGPIGVAIALALSSLSQATPSPAPVSAGVWKILPGDDGSLRREAQERLVKMRKLHGAHSTSSEGLEVVVRPDGVKMIDLQGRFQTAMVATIEEDGTISTGCTAAHDEEPR